MDVSYLLYALRYVRDEGLPEGAASNRPTGYQEAIEWLIEHVDANWFTFDEILDNEREERDRRAQGLVT